MEGNASSIQAQTVRAAAAAPWTRGAQRAFRAAMPCERVERLGPLGRAGLAVVLVGVALVLRLLLAAPLGDQFPFLTLFPAVVIAAIAFGRLGGLVATAAAAAAAWFLVAAPASGAGSGGVVVFVAMAVLVTAIADRHHRTRDALLAQERERLAVTLGSVGEGVIATDCEGRVTMLNDAAAALTGWTRAEADGRSVDEVVRLVDEETHQPLAGPVARALCGGEPGCATSDRAVLLARGGGERAVGESAAPLVDGEGRVSGVVLVLRDQAAQRRAARLVRARLDLHEFAPSHTLEEVLRRTLDEVARLTRSTIGFYHFVEADQRTLSLQTWSTRTMQEFCTAKGQGLHYPIEMAGVWGDAVRERRPVVHNDYASLPHRRGLPEGHAQVIRELVVPIVRDDRIVAIVGVGNKPDPYTADDVEIVSYLADAGWETTARKRAEEVREQLELQLRQAQKLESIGRLAGGIAHDFNNLLTVILSCARMTEEALKSGQPVDPEDVQEIRRAGERARDLTRRLLAFARKQAASPIPLDVNVAVRSVETLLRRVLGDDIELRVDLQEGLWPVLFDPGLLEQVLLNFAVNARDAMPEGGTLLIGSRNAEVETGARDRRREDQPGEWVRLLVRDTGLGLSPEARAHLFEPFFTTKETGKGTGLGLAMVHGIVSQAGGHIHVESAPGEGTAFEICLPRLARDVGAAEAPAPAEREEGCRGKETVLVVEDEAVVRAVIVRALQDAGYTLLEAGNATDALELFREEPRRIDLVVSDVRMLGQSGPAMARVMRRLRPDVRVLFVSGFPGDEVDLAAEGDGFLAKPFTREGLRSEVRAILERPPRAVPAADVPAEEGRG